VRHAEGTDKGKVRAFVNVGYFLPVSVDWRRKELFFAALAFDQLLHA